MSCEMEKPQLLREIEGALRRLLDEARSRGRSLRANSEPDEAESVALAQLGWRLQRLHAIAAPERLRRSGLDRALDSHPAWRLQRLTSVSAPERLRRTGLARALATPTVPPRVHAVPLAGRHQGMLVASRRLAATAAAIFLLGYGTFAASAASLPDSPLYPVKLLVEDARVAVAPAGDRPLIYVEQATRRLEEADTLISDGRIDAAERSTSDAAKRIESARAAAQQSPAPQVRDAIGSTVVQYRSVSESLAARGGSSPTVAGAQPAVVARAPASALAAIAPIDQPDSGDDADASGSGDPTAGTLQEIGAPSGNAAFAAIPTATALRATVTPEAVARVSAPSSNNF